MSQIFISYKHEDGPRLKTLIRVLEDLQFSVWWDDKIMPGARIPALIRRALGSVSCVIVVWSKISIESDWVLDEAGYGRDRQILIPISFDGCRPPLGFQQLLTQDLSNWNGSARDPRFQNLLRAIRGILGRSPSKRAKKSVPDEFNSSPDIARQYQAIQCQRVFLIIASFNEEWQISLNFHLIQAIQQFELLCTVLVPTEDHSIQQQRGFLNSILKDRASYLGGVVISSGWPDKLLKDFLMEVKRIDLPIILVDRNPPKNLKIIPSNLGYVSVSDEVGGQLAANAVLQLAGKVPIKRILVLAGYAKRARHHFFAKAIKASKKMRGCEVVITEDGSFDRWISENVAYNLLTQAHALDKPFDIIFCTADSMTLGCLDAISRIANLPTASVPKVIGYDGTVTTKNLAENKRSALIRIVVQDNREIARATIEQLIRFRQHKSGKIKSVTWVAPYLHPRIKGTLS